MRILYYDIDTLRADHLGCYGYCRDTSPHIDRIASEGVRFDNCYASDTPCLPSRASLFTGRFGIHTGIVNHGGTAADLRLHGPERGFRHGAARNSWVAALRQAGFYTVSVSPYAERHSAWWFYHGWREMYNPGKGGAEIASEVLPYAMQWLDNHATEDNWFLHVNVWDPHTPYRTPLEYGNPFEDSPPPSWYTEEIRRKHYEGYGPHSAREPWGWRKREMPPRMPEEIGSLEDYKKWIDGYDTGIKYMDDHIGQILDALAHKGVLDETAIIISADHGENQGELNIYGDHHTADHPTCRVPLIIKWPGLPGGWVNRGLHYQLDMAATVIELLGGKVPERWDGRSFAEALRKKEDGGREYLVISQCAWSCQRGVRYKEWLMIRTYHDGYHDFPPYMLFDIEKDPHELKNLADERPEVVNECAKLLEEWHAEMMETSDSQVDPLWTVIREGGPFHVRGRLREYCEYLRQTGRARHAEALERRHRSEL